MYVNPLPFIQYPPITEFCIQLELGVFQILKACIFNFLQRASKIHISVVLPLFNIF